jgi:hypothetical protein
MRTLVCHTLDVCDCVRSPFLPDNPSRLVVPPAWAALFLNDACRVVEFRAPDRSSAVSGGVLQVIARLARARVRAYCGIPCLRVAAVALSGGWHYWEWVSSE